MIDTQSQLRRPLGEQQRVRRDAERSLRERVVETIDSARSQREVANQLHIAPQTLSDWTRRQSLATPRSDEVVPRGRPPLTVDPINTTKVVEVLDSHGRALGLPALKSLFKDVPRTRLEKLRDQWRHDRKVPTCRLRWFTPGTVWSTDFTQPPEPIDGFFDHVLIVRDLASRCTLLAAPCDRQCAEEVVFHFTRLFKQYGPPLVLKSDNGSPFIAESTRDCCRAHRVVNLLSPPLTPSYNGSIEATGGALKARAAEIIRINGCDTWTSDILEASRVAANTLNRPWGPSGPTPEERWHARPAITAAQRDALATLIAQKNTDITQSIQRERRAKALADELTDTGFALSANDRATVARVAIRQALVELGHLQIRRPSIMSTECNVALSGN